MESEPLPTAYCVALTGGVASGKSAAADILREFGASVVDADVVAREIVRVGQPALGEIEAAFGRSVLQDSGELDRRALRERIFRDPVERRRLEAIVHPKIQARIRVLANEARAAAYVVIVIPLLVESGAYAWVDRILVIDVPVEIQRIRLVARDAVTIALADAMLSSQASRTSRLAAADDVVDNSGTLDELRARLLGLHDYYAAAATAKRLRNNVGGSDA